MRITQFILYHGSDVKVEHPAWDHGSKYLDFGQCFYTTYDRKTAEEWAEKHSVVHPLVSKYALNLKSISSGTLKIKRFTANEEWAKFVYNNRYNKDYRRPDYDIIVGPIADRGLSAHFAKVDSGEKTFEEIASLIVYDKYKSFQVTFCSDKSLKLLTYID